MWGYPILLISRFINFSINPDERNSRKLMVRSSCPKVFCKKGVNQCTMPFRSSHRKCSLRKGILRNFSKFTGKHLCQDHFFNKVAGLRHATLLKKSLWHSYFPVKFEKFIRTPFPKEHLRWLRLNGIVH